MGKQIDLTGNNISAVRLTLSWISNADHRGPAHDLDLMACLCGQDDKIPAREYLVYYGLEEKNEEGRPYSGDNSVWGAVDVADLPREGNQCTEDMLISLDHVWEGILQIPILVSINKYPWDRHKDSGTQALVFNAIRNATLTIAEEGKDRHVLQVPLWERFPGADVLEVGRFIRNNNTWMFAETGYAYAGGIQEPLQLFVPQDILGTLRLDKSAIPRKYFYADGGRTFGPFDKDVLLTKVSSDSQVLVQGSSVWKPAAELVELGFSQKTERVAEATVVSQAVPVAKKRSVGGLILIPIVLVLAMAGGAAYYFKLIPGLAGPDVAGLVQDEKFKEITSVLQADPSAELLSRVENDMMFSPYRYSAAYLDILDKGKTKDSSSDYYRVIKSFVEDLNAQTMNAYDYFSDTLESNILEEDLGALWYVDPESMDPECQDPKLEMIGNYVVKEGMNEAGNLVYSCWIKSSCFQSSLNKHRVARVKMDFGFSPRKLRIVSYLEMERKDQQLVNSL